MLVDRLTRAKIKMSPMRTALTPSKQFMMIVPESLGFKELSRDNNDQAHSEQEMMKTEPTRGREEDTMRLPELTWT